MVYFDSPGEYCREVWHVSRDGNPPVGTPIDPGESEVTDTEEACKWIPCTRRAECRTECRRPREGTLPGIRTSMESIGRTVQDHPFSRAHMTKR
jgi:hypothetical protein